MVKTRIYIDTSVIGWCFDIEFEKDTKLFLDRLENKEVIFILSDLFEFELLNAPINVREILKNYPENSFERVKLSEEAIILADLYIKEKVVGKSSI